jgi:hypothetical protein
MMHSQEDVHVSLLSLTLVERAKHPINVANALS